MMALALVNLTVSMVLALVLVLLVRNEDRVFGHARSRRGRWDPGRAVDAVILIIDFLKPVVRPTNRRLFCLKTVR